MASVFAILFILTAALAAADDPPPLEAAPNRGCGDEILSVSPCLSFVASEPEINVSSSPTQECCESFSSAFTGDLPSCLCHLIRDPSLLGFPLNITRLSQLSVAPCGSGLSIPPSASASPLQILCEGLGNLPPLRSPSGDEAIVPSEPIKGNPDTPPVDHVEPPTVLPPSSQGPHDKSASGNQGRQVFPMPFANLFFVVIFLAFDMGESDDSEQQ